MGAVGSVLGSIGAFILTSIYWLVAIMLLLGLPTFISGILVGIFGIVGHLIFIGIIVFALIYYFKNINTLIKNFRASRNIK